METGEERREYRVGCDYYLSIAALGCPMVWGSVVCVPGVAGGRGLGGPLSGCSADM